MMMKYLLSQNSVFLMRKDLLLLLIFLGVISIAGNAQEITLPKLEKWPAHPRILLVKGEEGAIEKSISDNPIWRKMHEAILHASDNMIGLPTLERKLIGRRLLSKGRECVRRIFYLSYSYRMTGEKKYLLRAEKEMLAISQFSDWNPSHFLDVAEMTMGMSIGYDWLYDKLSADSKNTIREAILRKGLEPSFNEQYNGFLRATHNWNQVCNAGMTYGALAVADDYPEISKQIIERAMKTISLPMADYKPDGGYPEGYSYWNYGTSFNVMFLSAIEKAFGSDWLEREFKHVDIGDRRLNQRLQQIVSDLSQNPQATIPRASGGWARTKGAYRFFDHAAVTPEVILGGHQAATLERLPPQKTVLMVQDTTSLNYACQAADSGLGRLGNRADPALGLWLHTTLAVNEAGTALGLMQAQMWTRDPAQTGVAARRKQHHSRPHGGRSWLSLAEGCWRLRRRHLS